jgi:hypothetical protein
LRAGTLAALSLAIALAGCGSSSETSDNEQPALPHALASALADKSDEIASALEGGDACGAAHQADELKAAVDEAISRGQVPAAFREELERTATDLQNEVNCPEEHEDKGKKEGHEDEGGETTTLGTTTLGTTTVATTTTEGSG